MQKYVKCWFESLAEANKKDRKNIIQSYQNLLDTDKFDSNKLDEILSEHDEYKNANDEDKMLARMDFNNFITRGRPYLRLKMSFEEYNKLELFMSQFR